MKNYQHKYPYPIFGKDFEKILFVNMYNSQTGFLSPSGFCFATVLLQIVNVRTLLSMKIMHPSRTLEMTRIGKDKS